MKLTKTIYDPLTKAEIYRTIRCEDLWTYARFEAAFKAFGKDTITVKEIVDPHIGGNWANVEDRTWVLSWLIIEWPQDLLDKIETMIKEYEPGSNYGILNHCYVIGSETLRIIYDYLKKEDYL